MRCLVDIAGRVWDHYVLPRDTRGVDILTTALDEDEKADIVISL